MKGIFGTMWTDLGLAALFGVLGGLGLSFLQEKGLEWPRLRYKEGVNTFTRLGCFADIFIGALAGIIFYALNPPGSATQLVASTVTAGLSGSAILKGYVQSYINGKVAAEQAKMVEGYKATTHMAMKGDMEEVHERMAELEQMEQQMKERWADGM